MPKKSKQYLAGGFALALTMTFAGCSAESTADPNTKSVENLEGVDALPADLQPAYVDSDQVAVPSPWKDFEGTDGPWKIGYASTFAGNQWRTTVLEHIREQVGTYEDAGLVSDFVTTESNLDVATTNQQIRQMVDSGVDGILTISPSSTGINQAIDYAHSKGVPVVNFDSPVTTENAINTGLNYVLAGKMQAEAMVEQMGAEGNLLMVNGIPGYASSEQLKAGASSVFDATPGIDVVATVDGLWASQIAKEKVLGALASNPKPIDGVWQSTSQAIGVIQAFQQARPDDEVPPVTISTDVAGATYWADNPDFTQTGFSVFPPFTEADIALDVLLRTLDGQGPIISSIIREPETFTYDDLSVLLPAGSDASSDESIDVLENTFLSRLPEFFENPRDLDSE